MIRIGLIGPKETGLDSEYFDAFKEHNQKTFEAIGLNIQPYDPSDLDENHEQQEDEAKQEFDESASTDTNEEVAPVSSASPSSYVHLHTHTHFSILQATSEIKNLVATAREMNMKALAISDKGNMYGAFKFHQEAVKNDIKPILGCEFYVCEDHLNKSVKDDGNMLVLLAKNSNGYRNLCKLSAISFLDGFYYVPRIDKKVLLEFKDDLIALSSGLRGEPSRLLLNQGEKHAEESIQWHKEVFGDDYYLELLRHDLEEEKISNDFFLKMGSKVWH